MKAGTQEKKKVYLAAGLFGIAILLFIKMLAGNSSPAAASAPIPAASTEIAAAPAVSRPAMRIIRGRNRPRPGAPVSQTLDPRLQLALLSESENTEYTGKGRNIFRAEEMAEIPTPVAPPRPVATGPVTPQPVVPQGPPPPPPINLKFFGFANATGSPEKKVFLSQGDDVFVASEGDIVNRRYRVVRITPNSIEIEDVLSNHRQTIPLTAGG